MQHGQFKIEQLSHYIKVSMKGDFNREGAAALSYALKQLINDSKAQEFALLINLLKFTGGTPEAYDEHESMNKWLLRQGLVTKAVVYNNHLLAAIAEQRMPSRKPKWFQVFDNEFEAETWLEQQAPC